MMLSYFKVRENAVAPHRSNPSDAGMDVFYCPSKGDQVLIGPGQNALLETGLKFGIPHGYMLQVCNRGSMGVKKSLVVGAHIIDSGYSGEVFIDLHNIGTGNQVIMPGDKIAQLVMVPVMAVIPMEAHHEESLYGMWPITISDRGEGRLGSSDVKTQQPVERTPVSVEVLSAVTGLSPAQIRNQQRIVELQEDIARHLEAQSQEG